MKKYVQHKTDKTVGYLINGGKFYGHIASGGRAWMYDVAWVDGTYHSVLCSDAIVLPSIVCLFIERDGDTPEAAQQQYKQLLDEANDLVSSGGDYDDMTAVLAEYGLDADYLENVVGMLSGMTA